MKGETCKSIKPIPWNDILRESFRALKEHVCQHPLFLFLDPSKHFEIETDASDDTVRPIFYQDGKPIAFESKKLSTTQCRSSIQEKELFTINYNLKTLRN